MQYAHEFYRTSKEAFGKTLTRADLEPRRIHLTPDQIVFWGCVAVGGAMIAAELAGVKLGG